MLGGQKQKMQAFAVFELRQGVFEGAPGGFAAGGVAVEAEIDVVGLAHQQAHMLGGGGGAQRGHAVADAELGKGDDVHIAFHHQYPPRFLHGGSGFVEAVEIFAFVKQRGVGRIEVFGFGIVEHAAAEADNLPADAADGKHDAVAEAVVIAVLLFVVHHHAAGGKRRAGIGLEHLRERRPAFGRVTQAVAGDDVGVQPAPLQIGLRFGADFELLGVKVGGGAHGVFQRLLLFLALGALGGVFARGVFVARHHHADAVGQLLHGFGKR